LTATFQGRSFTTTPKGGPMLRILQRPVIPKPRHRQRGNMTRPPPVPRPPQQHLIFPARRYDRRDGGSLDLRSLLYETRGGGTYDHGRGFVEKMRGPVHRHAARESQQASTHEPKTLLHTPIQGAHVNTRFSEVADHKNKITLTVYSHGVMLKRLARRVFYSKTPSGVCLFHELYKRQNWHGRSRVSSSAPTAWRDTTFRTVFRELYGWQPQARSLA
jgi:hypothetical protein